MACLTHSLDTKNLKGEGIKDMKIIKALATGLVCLLSIQAISTAISPVVTNEPKSVNENTTEQVLKTGGPAGALYTEKFDKLAKRYEKNLRECVPAHFKQYIDLFGLKININIDINGWKNNKCEYRAEANVPAIGDDIRESFGLTVTDEEFAQIKPVGECHFNQEQLNIAIDALVSEPKNQGQSHKKLSKKRETTPEEAKFMQMIMTQQVCQFTNKDEVLKQFDELFGSKSAN